jgi:hypothetical protein
MILYIVLALVAAIALALAVFGVFFIWLPFSDDPPEADSGFLIGFGCALLVAAGVFAWLAGVFYRAAKRASA